MAHDRHVKSAVALSETRLVVVEDVEGPVQSVLDQPVAAHGMSGPFGRQFGGGDKVSRVETALSFSPMRELTRTMVVASGRRSSPGKRRWPSGQPVSRETVTVRSSDAAMALVEIDEAPWNQINRNP